MFGSGGMVDFEMGRNIFMTSPEMLKWMELDGSNQLAKDTEHAKKELRELGQ